DISRYTASSQKDEYLLKIMECVAKLYRVFCNDFGGKDIIDAERIANELNNDILLAHVYKCADLMPYCPKNEKITLYEKAVEIFTRNKMEDHAVYCKNNILIEQFYTDYISTGEFKALFDETINNVPGMVGLTHICNNVGVAYLYCGKAYEAIKYFDLGIEYAKKQDRIVQMLALESNKMIAECYNFSTIEEKRMHILMRQIFDGMGINKLPFLSADYALNVLAVAYRQNSQLGYELINTYPIKELVNESFKKNLLCASERILQLQYLAAHYGNLCPLINVCKIPHIENTAVGKRKNFIEKYGFNVFDFSTWM
ncbi:MAG: hypothetical protein LUH47_08535, partial [Clostridiales bacterium]|nr:hypothetical protein [Clostridiales bacterium]